MAANETVPPELQKGRKLMFLTTHNLGQGWTAVRNGKGFDVFLNDVFKFYSTRLKTAKAQIKEIGEA